jgi:hypothetical protein
LARVPSTEGVGVWEISRIATRRSARLPAAWIFLDPG